MVKAWGVVRGQRLVWPEARVAAAAGGNSRAFLKALCLKYSCGWTPL